jgi:hypothetical protein
VEASKLITGLTKVTTSVVESFTSPAEIKLTHIRDLGEFGGAFLQLEEVVVGSLDALVSF